MMSGSGCGCGCGQWDCACTANFVLLHASAVFRAKARCCRCVCRMQVMHASGTNLAWHGMASIEHGVGAAPRPPARAQSSCSRRGRPRCPGWRHLQAHLQPLARSRQCPCSSARQQPRRVHGNAPLIAHDNAVDLLPLQRATGRCHGTMALLWHRCCRARPPTCLTSYPARPYPPVLLSAWSSSTSQASRAQYPGWRVRTVRTSAD